ncbi:MAG: PorP/SprF family type IX secretion system membrane protein [Bacteroidota bacterium]
MKHIYLFICFCLSWVGKSLYAQDPHLTQYFHAPVMASPAFIGNFDGKIRLNAAYRRQWATLGDPFVARLTTADFKLQNLGLAIQILDDGAGPASLRHTNGLLGFAYHREFMERHMFSIGVKGGFIQKRLDITQFSFDNQYNPELGFDPSRSSGEIIPFQTVTLGDLHAGAAYHYIPDGSGTLTGAHIAIGLSHVNQPNLSLFGEDAILPMQTTFTGQVDLLAGERLWFVPNFWWARQGTAEELSVGTSLKYEVDQEVFVMGGATYRVGDAINPFIGILFNGLRAGLSYDINISRLSGSTRLRGGPELTLTYIWDGDIKPKTNYQARSKRVLNDQDGDGIKDKNDKCPDVPGIRRYGGCPDSDGDGITDLEDLCPTQPGPKERNGCPALDRDGDGVLDKADECPDSPGLIAFKGCPDTDNDGLPDRVDRCPEEPGPRVHSGCPTSDIDADGDGIPDKIDMCPTLAGVPEQQGCPDSDQDGIADFEDACPTLAGKPENQGCPPAMRDSDKDGILDPDDKCPTVAGLAKFQGCPDTDGDGVQDFEDRCPLTPGKIEQKGCPVGNYDADGDGVLNGEDRCPYVPGLMQFAGCPDSDNDGISDLDDSCPSIAGLAKRDGCPEERMPGDNMSMPGPNGTPGTQPKFGPVNFDTDQAIIKAKYFRMLDELAAYMVENPTLKLQIAGHTDFEGDAIYNMMLGQSRAKAIMDYLAVRGIDRKRMAPATFGEIMPVDDNQSAEGRASNRRAELILMK